MIPLKLQSDPSSVQKHATKVKPQTGQVPRIGFRQRSIMFGTPAMFIAAIPARRPRSAPCASQTYAQIAAPIAEMVSLYDQTHLPRTKSAKAAEHAPNVHAPGNQPGW